MAAVVAVFEILRFLSINQRQKWLLPRKCYIMQPAYAVRWRGSMTSGSKLHDETD